LPWDHERPPRGDGAGPGQQEAREERLLAAVGRGGEGRCTGGSVGVLRRPRRPASTSTGGIKLALHIGTSLCHRCYRVTAQREALSVREAV